MESFRRHQEKGLEAQTNEDAMFVHISIFIYDVNLYRIQFIRISFKNKLKKMVEETPNIVSVVKNSDSNNSNSNVK